MSKKRKVRPPVAGHPDRRQVPQATKPFAKTPHPDRMQQAVLEAAEAIFRERGGARKQRMLKLYEDTMDVYECDVALAKSNQEGFKWRVRPNELMRLRREIDIVETEIETLREECYQIASQITQQMLSTNAQPEPTQAQTQHGPAPKHEPLSDSGPPAQKEVGATRPTETVQTSSQRHETVGALPYSVEPCG